MAVQKKDKYHIFPLKAFLQKIYKAQKMCRIGNHVFAYNFTDELYIGDSYVRK